MQDHHFNNFGFGEDEPTSPYNEKVRWQNSIRNSYYPIVNFVVSKLTKEDSLFKLSTHTNDYESEWKYFEGDYKIEFYNAEKSVVLSGTFKKHNAGFETDKILHISEFDKFKKYTP